MSDVELLRVENEKLRQELNELRAKQHQAQKNESHSHNNKQEQEHAASPSSSSSSSSSLPPKLKRTFGEAQLTKQQIERYSRQMLLPDLGAKGTKALLESTALVVGAGGLGATVIPYLVAAGIGRIIIVDFDTVEESNLHRQIIHNETRIGMYKAESAKLTAELLNSKDTVVEAICDPFSVENAQALCRRADVVIDASDNVACRYLVNDAAVMEGKPLVSGCATRWEGQLTVYNCRYPVPPPPTPAQIKLQQQQQAQAQKASEGTCQVVDPVANSSTSASPPTSIVMGPCYRCLFPIPTPAASVGSCNEVGVVGPVPGMVGCLQALEAIKVIVLTKGIWANEAKQKNASDDPHNNTNNANNIDLLVGRMMLFDGLRSGHKVVRVRGQQASCAICNRDNRIKSGVSSETKRGEGTNAEEGEEKEDVNALKKAHFGPSRLFPEYTTGIVCELPDSSPRVDKEVMMTAATTTEPLTLTLQTGIVCREETVVDLKEKIAAAAATAAAGNVGGGGSVIIVDVRPGPQQDMFALDSKASTEAIHMDVVASDKKGVIVPVVINTDTFERDVQKHVDTILSAVSAAVESSPARIGEKRKREEAQGGEGHFEDSSCLVTTQTRAVVPIHFICRRGNKSRKAIYTLAPLLKERLAQEKDASSSSDNRITSDSIELVNVIGGLTYWARDVDNEFPVI